MIIFVFGVTGAFVATQQEQPSGFGPSRTAVADIPPAALRIYMRTADRYDLDWAILAAIGKVETNHCRSTLPGVHSGANYAGAMGCMQFLAATWAGYGHGSPYRLSDAVPAAARYLVASGAPDDYQRAIFAYNHADWYVADVLAWAVRYRGALRDGGGVDGGPAAGAHDLREILRNHAISLTSGQRADLQSGGIDPRLLGTMAWIGRHHSYIVTALRHDHAPGTNHEAGRAVDIGSVDGEICNENWLAPSRFSACSRLALQLGRVTGPLRSTELIWCFDPDGADPRGFARADHCDHVHVGYDG